MRRLILPCAFALWATGCIQTAANPEVLEDAGSDARWHRVEDAGAADDAAVVLDVPPDAEPPPDAAPSPDAEPLPDAAPLPEGLGCRSACAEHAGDWDCWAGCDALRTRLQPDAFQTWVGCLVDAGPGDLGAPALTCAAALDCGPAEGLAGQHCDALGRCGAEGRGWFDEAACRADPYEEVALWACLLPERQDRVVQCLQQGACDDLGQCLAHATCDGEAACTPLVAGHLAIDCPGLCSAGHGVCYGEYGQCQRDCHEAARLLPPDRLRALEVCAAERVCAQDGTSVIRACAVETLACGDGALFASLRQRADECGQPHWLGAGERRAWDCLGEVHQARLRDCLDQPCADVAACLGAAECGDNPGCMAFLAPAP